MAPASKNSKLAYQRRTTYLASWTIQKTASKPILKLQEPVPSSMTSSQLINPLKHMNPNEDTRKTHLCKNVSILSHKYLDYEIMNALGEKVH
jgi:hypothetical protein